MRFHNGVRGPKNAGTGANTSTVKEVMSDGAQSPRDRFVTVLSEAKVRGVARVIRTFLTFNF